VTEKTNELCGQACGYLKEIDAFIDELARQGSLDGKLITILHRTQEIIGYLPTETQAHIARRLSIPPAKVHGVVSFYSFFSTVPKGKYVINVCMGTACFVVGAEAILNELKTLLGIEAGQTTPDRLFSLNALRCVGACGLAPVVVVNEKMYGKVTLKNVGKIIEEYKGVAANE
jgi:NADH:ubiquinone oxidoreductase subunit E